MCSTWYAAEGILFFDVPLSFGLGVLSWKHTLTSITDNEKSTRSRNLKYLKLICSNSKICDIKESILLKPLLNYVISLSHARIFIYLLNFCVMTLFFNGLIFHAHMKMHRTFVRHSKRFYSRLLHPFSLPPLLFVIAIDIRPK